MKKKIETGRTVLQRLKSLVKNGHIKSEPTSEQLLIAGRDISAKFFQNEGIKFIRKVKQVEQGGEFSVNIYPSFFVPVVDAILIDRFGVK